MGGKSSDKKLDRLLVVILLGDERLGASAAALAAARVRLDRRGMLPLRLPWIYSIIERPSTHLPAANKRPMKSKLPTSCAEAPLATERPAALQV